VSSTGILSRELYSLLKKNKKMNNFMCVGGMGHAISVASGIAINTNRKVFCFDGDGAATMHLGSLTTSALQNNIVHIIFNNLSHESVGGHATSSKHVKFYKLAKTLGYKISKVCTNKKDLMKSIKKSIVSKKSYFIEILCSKGHRQNISRPTEGMVLLKKKFMNLLNYSNEK
jgi:phosphonopyruvate decarboxylase